jgi:hypothetical protein
MMMQVKETSRMRCRVLRRSVTFLLSATILVASGFAMGVMGQQPQPQKPVATKKYGGRDPFKKYEPPPPAPKRSKDHSPIPSIQERITHYRAQKAAAMIARMPAPKPTTALLLSEIQVVGISRSPRGYAAIVEAVPIKLTYVVYPGEMFFDGQLVAIEDTRLVFRRETVFADGRRERTVQRIPLRQSPQVTATPAPSAANAAKP